MVENSADTWNKGEPKKQLNVIAKPSKFNNACRDISHWLHETTGHMPSRAEPIEKKEKEDHARLPAQMPASRVPRNPGGNNRQERKDAVSGQKDGNRGADNTLARQQDRAKRRAFAFGRKPTMRSRVT